MTASHVLRNNYLLHVCTAGPHVWLSQSVHIGSKHWLFGVLPVENLAPSNLLLTQSRTVKHVWPYHSCCLILVWDNTGYTYCSFPDVDIRQLQIQLRCRTELITVPVCLLDCIMMSLLALVYKVTAVITSWLFPTIQCIHYSYDYCTLFHLTHSTTTKKLVDSYEQQCQDFMASKTVNQFKALFPASATPSKLLSEKFSVELKLRKVWGDCTLDDLKNLVGLFSDPGKYFHLSRVIDGCIAVIWLCSTLFIKELKAAIVEATDLLQTKGVLKVFIEEELVLECSQPDQGTAIVYTALLPCAYMHSRVIHLFASVCVYMCVYM